MTQTKQVNGVHENGRPTADTDPYAYTLPSHPLDQRRRLRVAVMGAGFSGLYMTVLAEKVFQNIDLVVYEKNPDLGGTWFENRYPGCACDIPAHNYTFSFEAYPKFVG
jgi:cation diffusion facilitator CzcD-associated flavoprotein CzcO